MYYYFRLEVNVVRGNKRQNELTPSPTTGTDDPNGMASVSSRPQRQCAKFAYSYVEQSDDEL